MAMQFRKATKAAARLRLALIGPAGSGKTWTALTLATALGKRVAVIDTERGSSEKYSDHFAFDVLTLEEFHPLRYVEAMKAAADGGYDVLVIDSLSHAWVGKGGALELHDQAVDRQKTKNTYTAWRDVTPHHNALVDALIQSPCHVIATMRAKTEHVQEKDERTGRTVVRKVGMAPVQRDGMEYEMDVVADMDMDNTFVVTKTRCPELTGAAIRKPDARLAATLAAWLGAGPVRAADKPTPSPAPAASQVAPPDQPTPADDTPASGAALLEKLIWIEGEMAKRGWCKPGDLLRFLEPKAQAMGYPERMEEWGRPAVIWAMAEARAFKDRARRKVAGPDAPRQARAEQATQIRELAGALNMSGDELNDELGPHGAAAPEQLTEKAADEVLARLRALLDAEKSAVPTPF